MCFNSFEQERFDAFESIVLIPLPTRGMLFMISAYDSIAMYLAIEPQSLCFYVIAVISREPMDLTLGLGNSVTPLPEPIIPDLNLPPEEPPEEPYQPLIPGGGSLSVEEQRAIDRFVRQQNRLVRCATHMLRSLDYSPQPEDVKNVVETFILEIDSFHYSEIYLALIDRDSPQFLHFLELWEEHLTVTDSLVQNIFLL
ncbi:hypothetical protein NitaMp165 (mitochondrion) [Nicotiana tabacum]|uniref:Uncharacterized protein n=1 Tax=Nicotiana tabacum TaxID=4097 RepID=Q5M9R0_TOBAC|nr:hypothetical protein NitaMp028 [Nicotiana tabacum]YP_173502.1 hypothetical protein NitaMp165 [Nicotiana tabacum]BAD83438.1 hypothetical protein [Nicotiana tabacum]BAD83568.1 hypothetical protein [Nicotiana tabacum]